MAKRAALTFDAMKVAKGGSAARPAPIAPPPTAVEPGAEKRGRGRPAKRPEGVKLYGMTLRIPSDLRRALRRLAEDDPQCGVKREAVADAVTSGDLRSESAGDDAGTFGAVKFAHFQARRE